MNIYFSLLVLLFACLSNVHAQPTSIAGIIPGKTTVTNLVDLVTKHKNLEDSDFHLVELKNLDGTMAFVKSSNGVVYNVEVHLFSDSEMLAALLSKYGKPVKKSGAIKRVKCGNKLGATFDRVEGEVREYWRPNDGIQAYLIHRALQCAESLHTTYVIENIQTARTKELEETTSRIQETVNKVNKMKEGL